MLLPPSIAAANDRALQTLARSIRLNPGEFSLIVVRCNYGRLRRMVISHLREVTDLDLRELRMGTSPLPLHQAVRAIAADPVAQDPATQSTSPQAVMVTGLEAVPHLETLFSGANLVRDEFRKHCPFALVLWVSDLSFQTLTASAPDLKNFAASSIAFKFPVGELLYSLRSYVDHLFATLLNEGGDRFLPNSFINLDPGSRLRTELEFALADIYASGLPLDRELKASIEFLQGRDAQARLEMERARLFYERSLAFWAQQSNLSGDRVSRRSSDPASLPFGDRDFPIPAAPLPHSAYRERQACLLFHLGSWWRRYARMQRADYRMANLEAKRYFEQCLEIFQQDHRPELVARFITALGETLRKLELWDALEAIAQQGVKLHETYTDPSRLARDYGFLAEVALARLPQTVENWTEAKIYAEQAIDILDRLEQAPGRILTQSPTSGEVGQDSQEGSYKTLPKLANQAVSGATADLEEDSLALEEEAHRGWYLLLLARSLAHLNARQAAIEALEEALSIGTPQLDPTLYIQALAELRSLYFQQARYWEAFQAKQRQRILRQQYGFTAFVGASRLVPHQIAGQEELAASVVEAGITQEIAASGRQQDVNRLVARVSLPKDKLTVIHGASGVGKSSILTVGLIPALRQKRTIEARLLLPVSLSVYTDWSSSLDRALSRALEQLEEAINPGLNPAPSTPDALLTQLQQAIDRNFYPVLIFDQFEEFFFAYQTAQQRRSFYLFLRDCLNLPYVKVILSLREDYLHYLLEVDRIADLEVINHDILSKAIRYPLGDFPPQDARTVILSLTERSQFSLEMALVDRLVTDLAGELGGVRPIELQIVGAQLQDENITTLTQYEQLGALPKEALVQRSLEDVIRDCGAPNEAIAKAVLFLLTNADATRPLKTQDELIEELTLAEIPHTDQQLDLVLEILVGSGLVLKIPEEPAPLHQLVHDYLIPFIRDNRDFDLQERITEIETEMAAVQKQRDQLAATNRALDHTNQQLAQTNQDLSYANQELSRARQQERRVRSRTAFASATLLLAALGLSLYLAVDAKHKVSLARKQERTARAEEQDARAQERDAKQATEIAEGRLRSTAAQAQANLARSQQRVEAVRQQRQQAQQAVVKAQQELAAAQTALQQASQGTGQALQARQLAEAKVAAAEIKLAQARSQLDRANADVAAAQAEEQQALISRQEAIQSTKLERSGLAALQQFQFAQLEALVAAVKAGKELKLLGQAAVLQKQSGDRAIANPSLASPLLTASPLLALQTITDNIHEQVQVGGQQGSLWTAQFSPDGQSWITGSSNGRIQRWTLQGNLIQSIQTGYASFLEMQISPDGQRLLTRGNPTSAESAPEKITAILWDLQGNRLATLQTAQSIAATQFRPDGQQIATGSEDGTLTLWSAQGDRLGTIATGQTGIRSVQYSPNGQLLATVGDDNTVKLWNSQGKLQETLNATSLINVQFSPSGQQLVTIAADRTIQIWSTQGILQTTIADSHMGDITSVHFSPDGSQFVTTSTDGTAILWTTAGKQQAVLRGHRGSVLNAQFSSKGETLATLGDDKTVRLWDNQGNPIAVFRGHRGRILSLQFSPDGQRLATSGADGTARLWSLSSNAAIELPAASRDSYSLQFSPNTHRLAIANLDGSVTLRTAQGQAIATLPAIGRLRGLQFSPDGQQIAIASDNLPNDTVIRVWDAQANAQANQLIKLVEPLGNLGSSDRIALAFSPDGQTLAMLRHNTLSLWTLPTRQKIEVPHQTSVQFSPDGQSLAAIGTDGMARLFDLQGNPLRDFRADNPIGDLTNSAATVLQFSASGQQIAIASVDGVIRLWNLPSNAQREFRGHSGNVLALQFSPNGQLLASAGVDGTARLWDLQGQRNLQAQQLAEFRGHQGDVLDVQFSPNGDRLATRGDDNTLRLWNLQGQQIAQYEGYPTAISDDWQTIATGGSRVRLWQVSSLDGLIAKSCRWLQDYLLHAPEVNAGDRAVCEAE
jgi:WD40 repeat protein